MKMLFFQLNIPPQLLKIVLFTSLFVIPLIGNTQEDLKPIVPIESIDKVLADWNDLNKPGIAVGVVSNGQIVHTKGYGSANLESHIPVTADTKFYAGEIARQFIVFSVLLLEDQGKLSLNDDIRKYIPELPNYGQIISLHHLINHTSGLAELQTLKALAGWQNGRKFSKENAMSLMTSQHKLRNTPGKKQENTYTNFVLLEHIISVVSGQPFTNYVQEHIFEPLKMTNSIYSDSPEKVIANRAQGYDPDGKDFLNVPFNYDSAKPTPLFCTVEDLCKWAINFSKVTVGNQTIIQKMEAPTVVDGNPLKELNTTKKIGQHHFWNYNGTRKLYLIGGGNGYSSKLIRNPDQDVSVVVMGNSSPYIGSSGTQVTGLYVKEYFTTPEPTADNNAVSQKTSVDLTRDQLKSYATEYWNKEGFYSRRIYLKNDTLRYFRRPGNESLLVPINDHTFRMLPYDDIFIEFGKDQKGAPIMSFIAGDDAPNISYAYQKSAPWAKNLEPYIGTFTSKELGISYTFVVKGDQLLARHPQLGEVTFQPLMKNVFAGNAEHFGAIEFKRNAQSKIEGFQLSANGIPTQWFEKESDVISTSYLRKTSTKSR